MGMQGEHARAMVQIRTLASIKSLVVRPYGSHDLAQ